MFLRVTLPAFISFSPARTTKGICLGTDALATYLINNRQTIGGLLFTEIDEEHLGRGERILGIEVQGVQHIIDAIDTKGDAYTRETGETEDAREVVVATTTGDAAHLDTEGLDFEDCSSVVV